MDPKDFEVELLALQRTLDRYLPGFSRRLAEARAALEEARSLSPEPEHPAEFEQPSEEKTKLTTLEIEEHALGAGE